MKKDKVYRYGKTTTGQFFSYYSIDSKGFFGTKTHLTFKSREALNIAVNELKANGYTLIPYG